jgi:hypothetical protein
MVHTVLVTGLAQQGIDYSEETHVEQRKQCERRGAKGLPCYDVCLQTIVNYRGVYNLHSLRGTLSSEPWRSEALLYLSDQYLFI